MLLLISGVTSLFSTLGVIGQTSKEGDQNPKGPSSVNKGDTFVCSNQKDSSKKGQLSLRYGQILNEVEQTIISGNDEAYVATREKLAKLKAMGAELLPGKKVEYAAKLERLFEITTQIQDEIIATEAQGKEPKGLKVKLVKLAALGSFYKEILGNNSSKEEK